MSHVIDHLVVGPFSTNVYVLGCTDTLEGAIIDAGGDGPGLLKLAESFGLKVTKILQTHAHLDHVAAIGEVKAATQAPIYLHPADAPLYNSAPQQGQMFGFPMGELPPFDEELADGQEVQVGNLKARCIHLPGHSPGGTAFYFESIGTLFVGDVLFAGSMGRVDLPGADPAAMRESLQRLTELPDDTRVLPGHGPETTIGIEKASNPYLKGW